ncbi:alpha/beta fold hydrolase [Amycolatopsis sp. A133]|uniref:alpha/beta fold hydrolase n=1 Tax=Amycolatopsis sp. A133 TaxID=3064472 RepID=UPI0027F31AFE|nr:alpha/beta fold hydrolase [Amycolatopsis sp. A133]MDQ7807360.1 alpha/beta fold hydrolase [Amycolatopsis sp. A133]
MKTDPLSEHHVLVQGLSTSYFDEGTGPVLLLVHGNVTTYRSWQRIVEEFRTTHRVLALSLPGYGGTSPQEKAGLDNQVAFLGAFLDALSVDEAIVLGHSAGGLIAATFALEHPGRVTRLVLSDSAGLGRAVSPLLIFGSLPPDWVIDLVTAALVLPGGGVPRALVSGLQLRRPWLVSFREWRDQIRLTQARTLLSTSFRLARLGVGPAGQRRRYRIDDRLGELSMPTLVIWGLTDEVFPIWQGVRAAGKIPRGRLAVLMSAGHVGYLDSHVEFVDVLSPFVRDEPTAPSVVDGGGQS